MSLKNRFKFAVAGVHPLLGMVRDHFIQKGLALVPWDSEEYDFCLIGADIGDLAHPPLAQIELQKMQVGDRPVLLLSTSKVYASTLVLMDESRFTVDVVADTHGAAVYALAAEHIFGLGDCLAIRPFNVYGPDVSWGVVHEYISAAKRRDPILYVPRGAASTCFTSQEDFLHTIDKLIRKGSIGVFNVSNGCHVTYRHLASNIWKFANPGKPLPSILEAVHMPSDGVPDTLRLLQELGWLPKTTVRSGVFKML